MLLYEIKTKVNIKLVVKRQVVILIYKHTTNITLVLIAANLLKVEFNHSEKMFLALRIFKKSGISQFLMF